MMISLRVIKQSLFTGMMLLLALGVRAQDSLRILFAGDVMQHGGQIEAAYNAHTDSYDYKDCFKFVKPIIQKTDIAIANLEVTHAGKPYKGYPQFSAPPQLSEGVVDAGFNVIITANNHSCDGGAKGIIGTLDVLDKLGVKHTGTFRSKAERDANYPLLIEKKGIKVAILNYTYGTNGLSVAAPLIVNYIDSAVMEADFKKAKKMGADLIVCTLHWGSEYQPLPNAYQKNFEKYCYELGADMVIGGHPHVLQPIEKKVVRGKTRLTVWSLGNFVSNQRDRYKNGGMMVQATVVRNENQVQISDVGYYLTWVYPRKEGITKPFYILPDFAYNNYNPEFLSAEALVLMEEFMRDSRALFAEHNVANKELIAAADPELVNRYQAYMEGYYTVLLEESETPQFKAKLHQELQLNALPFTRNDGRYALLYGQFASREAAESELLFLKDLGVTAMKVVQVNPNTIQYNDAP